MRIVDANIIVFDTETTGIDTANDRIVELGLCEIRAGVVGEPRAALVNPGVDIPAAASAIHRIFAADVEGRPNFAAVGQRFVARAETADVLCGFNAVRFDVPLVNAELDRHGIQGFIDPVQTLDPFLWLRRRHWHLPRSLGQVCERFGVQLGNAHTAGGDVTATAKLLLVMVREGIIPSEIDRALEGQARILAHMQREDERWGHWLYVDAVQDGPDAPPRLSAGKHRGALLSDVDKGFIEWAMARPDIHPGASAAFAAELDRRARS